MNCKDFVQILWILFTILTGEVHSGLTSMSLEDFLKQSNISTTQWLDIETDRSTWRRSIHDGLMLYDDSRRERNATKRARRHAARNAIPSASQAAYMCRLCGRTCSSRIGILSHERACNKAQRTWHMTAMVVSTGSITYVIRDVL